ncbi:MAG: hypothetical protein WC797_00950 [Candidatus Paceibacterota bacterium]|jgi:deoxycytidylate deaminase
MEIDAEIKKELERVTSLSDSQPKCGAIIAKGKNILSRGFAFKMAPVPENELLVAHAEESALLDALKRSVDVSGADIYVLLIKKTGEIRYTDASYCCVVCSRLLKQTNVASIFYPIPGGWAKDTVDGMFSKAVKRVEETNQDK